MSYYTDILAKESVSKSQSHITSEKRQQAIQEAQPDNSEAAVKFDVNEYRVRGNSLLQRGDIERVLYNYLGANKTIEDIENAKTALELLYKDSGYPTVIVDIPEQDVQNGIVKFKVTEAKIYRLDISGSKYFSVLGIQDDIPALAKGNVLYLPAFQQQIANLNSATPDRVLTPILRPGKVPGTVEVELKVQDELPLHGKLEINDRYSANTTRLRTSASVQYSNLWQKAHSVSFQYLSAPEDTEEVRVLMGTYVAPFKNSKFTLAGYAVHSNSDVAATDTVTVIGNGNVFGMRLIFPPMFEPNGVHSFEFGVDYKDFGQDTRVGGMNSDSTPIEYFSFALQYSGNNPRKKGYTRYNISSNFGLNSLNQKDLDCVSEDGISFCSDQFTRKRAGAKANYFYVRGDLSYEQRFNNNYGFFVSLAGQLADSPLISNEQFSIGGATTVRGYRESELLGDDGLMGTIELRAPSFGHRINRNIQSMYYLVFIDNAIVRNRLALAGESINWNLRSAGFGFRFLALSSLSVELDFAKVFEDSAKYEGDIEPEVKAGDSRLHFLVNYRF